MLLRSAQSLSVISLSLIRTHLTKKCCEYIYIAEAGLEPAFTSVTHITAYIYISHLLLQIYLFIFYLDSTKQYINMNLANLFN